MIEKPKRPKQLNNQERKIPANIQELIIRYDLDNIEIYDYLDRLVTTELLNFLYPIGSIYLSVNSVNPSNFLGGTWVAWGTGKVPVGVDTSDTDFDEVEKTGGEKTHTLILDEIPSHYHRNPLASLDDSNFSGVQNQLVVADSDTSHATGNDSYPTTSKGGDQPHNNLQPYITCYMWKRTN